MTDVFRGQFVGDLQYFIARREPQNRTCLCRAGASRRSLESEPSSQEWLQEERLPRQWKKSFVSHRVVAPAIASMEECLGVVVLGWSPVPSLLFQGVLNGADTKSVLLSVTQKYHKALWGATGPDVSHFGPSQDFKMVLTVFSEQQLRQPWWRRQNPLVCHPGARLIPCVSCYLFY